MFVTIAAIITVLVQILFYFNFVLEHFKGQEGRRQSLGGDDAGMDYSVTAAARQLRGRGAGGLSRAI